jgi:hypothetical protein
MTGAIVQCTQGLIKDLIPTQDQNHKISKSEATWNFVVLVQVGL